MILHYSAKEVNPAAPGQQASGGCWPTRTAGFTEPHGEFAAGRSWTLWDMIHNRQGADQADSECTDKWRTGSAVHAAVIGESAAQRLFRWVGMGRVGRPARFRVHLG